MTALDKLKAAYRHPTTYMTGIARVVIHGDCNGPNRPVIVFNDGTWTEPNAARIGEKMPPAEFVERSDMFWCLDRFVTAGLLSPMQAEKARDEERAASTARHETEMAASLRRAGWSVTPPVTP